MALRVRIAKPGDNDALIALARRSPMRGILTLYIDRAPDFFFLNRQQGDPWRVYVAEKDERIVGSISIAYRSVYIGGRETTIAYISDAKIPPEERGSTVAFRLLKELYDQESSNNPPYFVCSALRGNDAVMNLFKGRAGIPALHPVGDVDVVNLIPFGLRRHKRTSEVRSATENDIPAIVQLLNEYHRRFNFAPVFSAESFSRMLDGSMGCSIRDYVLTEDHDGIRAVAARWDQSANKGLVVMRHSAVTFAMVAFSQAIHPFRILPRLPSKGSTLSILQVRHLASRDGCAGDLRKILEYISSSAIQGNFHVIQMALSRGDPIAQELPAGLKVRIPLTVFCGSLTGKEVPPKIRMMPSYEDVSLV